MKPDFIAESISKVDFEYLKKLGIKACLIDLDGTVVSAGKFKVDRKVRKFLKSVQMPLHIATNRPKSRSLKNLKEDLNAVSVIHPRGLAGKPSKLYYKNASKSLKLQPSQLAMIGDRFIQDILGANRAGLYSVLVHKFGDYRSNADKYISETEKILLKIISSGYRDA